MSQAGSYAIGMMIEKFSEFLEWAFAKNKKSESDALAELNYALQNQLNLTIFDIAENPFEELKIKLEKADPIILNNIISLLFKVSLSKKNNNQMFQKLKLNEKLNERILEIISCADKSPGKLSLESRNIKNSLMHKLKLS